MFIVLAFDGQKPQFRANLGTRATPVPTHFTESLRAKFGVLEQTQGLHLPATFYLNVFFIVSASCGQKQLWTNFDILGAPVPTPFYR